MTSEKKVDAPLSRTLYLSLLAIMATEILFILKSNLFSFALIWEVLFLLGIISLIKKTKVKFSNLIALTITCYLLSSLVLIFIPESVRFSNARYFGIEHRATLDEHEVGHYDESTDYDDPLEKGFIYEAKDAKLGLDMDRLEETNEYVEKKGFWFWQTGSASGFNDSRIKERIGNKGGFHLFFTVGSLAILECISKGILFRLPFFLAVSFFCWYRKVDGLLL